MVKLHAIAFDRYKNERTTEGVIYNIVDQDNIVIVQYPVSHKEYTLHDLLIENESRAPSTMRRALQTHLDSVYGKNQWVIKTVFSGQMVRRSERLRAVEFTDKSIKMTYDIKDKEVGIGKANQSSQNGF